MRSRQNASFSCLHITTNDFLTEKSFTIRGDVVKLRDAEIHSPGAGCVFPVLSKKGWERNVFKF